MKILFVAAGPETWGSSRMRAYWPARYIAGARTIEYQEFKKQPIEADVFIWQKLTDLAVIESYPRARHFWDVCDPAWWWQPNECRKIAASMTRVVASSFALADDFNAWCGSEKAVCIPDRLELDHFPLQARHGPRDTVRLIWFGIAVNRISLFGALVNMERLAANGHKISLTILDNRPDDPLEFTDMFPVYHALWKLKEENRIIADHDLAILPPYPGAWGHVKSNNKQLTARACGVPAANGDNYIELKKLVDDPDWRTEMGKLEPGYDIRQSAAEWERLLCD